MPSLTASPTRAPSRQQYVVRSLLAAAEGIRRVLEQDLKGRDITLQQYNVLRILADAGTEGVPTLAVADKLLERTPGVTRLMDRLERQGLIARSRGADRRQVFCSITDSGAALVAELTPSVARAEELVVGGLNPNELGALQHFLNRIRGSIDKA